MKPVFTNLSLSNRGLRGRVTSRASRYSEPDVYRRWISAGLIDRRYSYEEFRRLWQETLLMSSVELEYLDRFVESRGRVGRREIQLLASDLQEQGLSRVYDMLGRLLEIYR